jgi:hypothetical protein
VVRKALTIVQAASSPVAYGRAGALTVTLGSPGVAQTRQLSGGSVTFTLPRTLTVRR